VLAALTTITVIQRVWHVKRELERSARSSSGDGSAGAGDVT
jgi:hypothetical protein